VRAGRSDWQPKLILFWFCFQLGFKLVQISKMIWRFLNVNLIHLRQGEYRFLLD
jgi:hypothetical protein